MKPYPKYKDSGLDYIRQVPESWEKKRFGFIAIFNKGLNITKVDLRDNENVPLTESVEEYFAREVKPHVPDACIDTSKSDEKDGRVGVVGYEIPFSRHFYEYKPPRDLKEIDADLDKVTKEIMQLLQEVHS